MARSVRLTDYHRRALTRCIMNDTPMPTAVELKVQAQAALFAAMPDDMRAFAQAHPSWAKNTDGIFIGNVARITTVVTGTLIIAGLEMDEVDKALQPIAQLLIDRETLEVEVESALKAFSTVKAMLSAMPELEKYVSHLVPAAAANLPAVTNVVAKLSQAGWPKGKE